MAKRFQCDDLAATMKAYAVNHASTFGGAHDIEYQWWKNARSLNAIPWGADRNAAITAAATAFSVTLTATSPWTREQQFWALYSATPLA